MERKKTLIYFADLTHTGTVISSNVHPLGIGLIAAYLLKKFPEEIEIELFKYPEDLSAALGRQVPDIMGFANYSWNLNLSFEFAKRVKRQNSKTIIVFGGPNYGLEQEEVDAFWKHYDMIDFNIVREGESAMVELYEALKSFDFDIQQLKEADQPLANCHYRSKERINMGKSIPRIELTDIPSPYLMGLMDKFFDHVLMPLIHTTRGCPFQCTFCAEGSKYYQKVKHQTDLKEELEYIAQRIKGRKELFISDANFGMYNEDIDKAKIIASVQEKYGFPTYIHVSSGKNQKDRVINVATIVKGAMRSVAAALQSTDETVLKNVKRSNISLDSLSGVAHGALNSNVDTYTELILGLPGDSLQAHTNTIRDVVEADLGIVRMYQLILLPQTELNTPDSRRKFGMKTSYRIMPRSFGKYKLFGEEFTAVEYEEICIANDTLSFEDYLQCRELNLTVEIIHNGRTFKELKGLCEQFGINWYDFLLRFHGKRHDYGDQISELYETFREGSKRLWDKKEDLEQYVSENIDVYLTDKEGTNEMSRAKSNAFFRLIEDLHDALYQEMIQVLEEKKCLTNTLRQYLQELKEYSLLQKKDIINIDAVFNADLHFDFTEIARQDFKVVPDRYLSSEPISYRFAHNEEQKDMIKSCIDEYGTSIDGLSRIIMFRIHYKKLFREVSLSKDKALV